MDIVYTTHSEEQVIKRKFPKIWIQETISYPDTLIVKDNKHYATRKMDGITLKVVYVKESYIKVITAYRIK